MITQSVQRAAIPVTPTITDRKRAIETVKTLRKEWAQIAGSSSLIDTYASIGLVLVDLVVGLGLNKAEAIDALGITYFLEVQHILVDIEPPDFAL